MIAFSPLRLPAVLAACVLILTLTGCVVCPDYRGSPDAAPLASAAARFNHSPAQGVIDALGVADGWTALNDPQLNGLIDTALENSPDIQIARARLR